MIVPEELIRETLTEVVEQFLKPKFIALGMNASGDWLRSLEVRTSLNRGEIWGADYTRYLVNGRSPGKRPPIAPLVRWVGFKFGYSGQQAVSTAFAIANKIAQEGTEYYPTGTDLLEILESTEVQQFVNKKIGDYILQDTQIRIVRMMKENLITV